MAALIVFTVLIIGGFTFIIIRLSISCMFWFSKNPNDKALVFKTYFPYYMIILFGLELTALITFNYASSVLYYSISTYVLALLIWNFKLKYSKSHYSTIVKQQNHSIPNYHE
ncbi:hypothetical protein [Winogradskyella sp. PC D3.3]